MGVYIYKDTNLAKDLTSAPDFPRIWRPGLLSTDSLPNRWQQTSPQPGHGDGQPGKIQWRRRERWRRVAFCCCLFVRPVWGGQLSDLGWSVSLTVAGENFQIRNPPAPSPPPYWVPTRWLRARQWYLNCNLCCIEMYRVGGWVIVTLPVELFSEITWFAPQVATRRISRLQFICFCHQICPKVDIWLRRATQVSSEIFKGKECILKLNISFLRLLLQ